MPPIIFYRERNNVPTVDANTINELSVFFKQTEYDVEAKIKSSKRWEIFYHLTDLRSSIIKWYPFKECERILEIGGELGALTGVFCEKCNNVTTIVNTMAEAEIIQNRYKFAENLNIVVGDIEDIRSKFDIIFISNIFREIDNKKKKMYTVESQFRIYISLVQELLANNGRVIFTVDNRIGIKFFCGETSNDIKEPFDGIRNLKKDNNYFLPTKAELCELLDGIDLEYKFYYPMPDGALPQILYTDEYLPKANVLDKVMPYSINTNSIICREQNIYGDLVKNNLFPAMANTFLVECCKNTKCFSDIIYVASSVDRGKEGAYFTSIGKDGRVIKRPVYNEGIQGLQALCANMKYIHEYGCEVVEHNLIGNTVTMPFIKADLFMTVLSKVVRVNIGEFFQLLDNFFEKIIHSSEWVYDTDNVLLNYGLEYDWGPILKRSFIDMVPINCFYANKEFIFFDQEFLKENYPAKYTLFRTILYMYIYDPEIESIISINYLKERYHLNELWDVFLNVEGKFISKIRNHELYNNYYRWTNINEQVINANINRLVKICESTEKEKNNCVEKIEVPSYLYSVRDKQLELVKDLLRVCQEEELIIFPFYGTLLGCVRHGGYIPWDDDVDFVMPREDYNKLVKNGNKLFKDGIFLQTPYNDEKFFCGGYSKLRYENTTAIRNQDWGASLHQGIWIDILPLDKKVTHKQKRKIKFWQMMAYAKVYGYDYADYAKVSFAEWAKFCRIAKFLNHKLICTMLDYSLQHGYAKGEDEVAILARYSDKSKKEYYHDDYFKGSYKVTFEAIPVQIPIGYMKCLTVSYGGNYMQLPPKEYRKGHADVFFDVVNSWSVYTEHKFVDNGISKRKKIILVGGESKRILKFIERYRGQYIIDYILGCNQEILTQINNYEHVIVREINMLSKIWDNEHVPVLCDNKGMDIVRESSNGEYFLYWD